MVDWIIIIPLILSIVFVILSIIYRRIVIQESSIESLSKNKSFTDKNHTDVVSETEKDINIIKEDNENMEENVNSVTSAAKEMASSIKEISKKTSGISSLESKYPISNHANEYISEKHFTLVINRLGTSMAEIGNIVKVISSIAEQTNLLALNAAVEAARAGEQGKGFVIVANNVKELARETAKATEDITNKIKIINEDSQNAINVLKEILLNTTNIHDISNTISSAIEEHTITAGEINRSLFEVSSNVTKIAQIHERMTSIENKNEMLSKDINIMANKLKDIYNSIEDKIGSDDKL